MRTIIITLAIVITASVAAAPQQTKSFNAVGFGLNTCSKFARDYRRSASNELQYFAWAQGFMSGVNIANQSVQKTQGANVIRYRDLSTQSVRHQTAYIRSYCNAHPLNEYKDAVIDLLGTMPFKTAARHNQTIL
jgi:hypothetical protein